MQNLDICVLFVHILIFVVNGETVESGRCHCLDSQACKNETGICSWGLCDIGWQPFPFCNRECNAGRFGQNCEGVCHCPAGDTCVKSNGLCHSGTCLYGWSGPSCQTRLPVMSSPPTSSVLGPEEVLLSWQAWSVSRDIGQGPIALYTVQVHQKGNSEWLSVESVAETGSVRYNYTVKCLMPGTDYSFRLLLAMDMEGKQKTSVPSPSTHYLHTPLQDTTWGVGASTETMYRPVLPPMNLKVEEITVDTVQLSWQPPSSALTLSYMISVQMEQTYGENDHTELLLHTQDAKLILEDLVPASLYKVSVVSHAEHTQPSQPTVLTFWTLQQPFSPPPPPSLINITEQQLYTLLYRADYSHAPPPVYLVVVEDLTKANSCPTEETLNHRLTTGLTVDLLDYNLACSLDLAYFTVLVIEEHRLSEEGYLVVIGDNTTTDGYWNSPLKLNHQYAVWTCLQSQLPSAKQTVCDRSKELAQPAKGILYPNTVNVAAIICGVVFTILFLILLAVCVICCYRKHRQKKAKYQDIISYHLGPTLYDTMYEKRKNRKPGDHTLKSPKIYKHSQKFQSDESLAMTEKPTCDTVNAQKFCSSPIVCKELVNVYETIEKWRINEEFKQLPDGVLDTTVAAQLPENQPCNRSKKVLPYDKNRVCLLKKKAIDNDYINASNVKSHMHTFYIVTQAPLKQTVCAFWRLVWEQNVDCIVTLVGEEEGCEEYWLLQQTEEWAGIDVRLLATSHTAHYTVRWIQLTQCTDGEKDVRNLAHFHYTTWTHTLTPHHPIPFLDFTQRVHATHQEYYHILVHCKLGTGRSGLFVALSALMYEGKLTNRVDITRAVHVLRQERKGLVATNNQYKFLYEALVEFFHYRETRFQENKFEFIYENMLSVSSPDNRSIIATEFDCLTVNQRRKVLNHVFKWTEYSSFHTPTKSPMKNGVPNPALVEDSPSELMMATMDSHRHHNQFILTLYPCKPQQVLDFWHMVYQEACCCIVMVNETDFSQPAYWPAQGESFEFEGLEVTTLATQLDSTNSICMRDIEIKAGQGRGVAKRQLRHYQWRVWPHSREVPGVEQLLHLLQVVRDWVKSGEQLVVHSAHGVSRSALLCVVWLCLERLQEEGLVDVYRTTRYARSSLSAAITNLEQYRFLYKVVKEWLRKERQRVSTPFQASSKGPGLSIDSINGHEMFRPHTDLVSDQQNTSVAAQPLYPSLNENINAHATPAQTK